MLKINFIPFILIGETSIIQVDKNINNENIKFVNEVYGSKFTRYEGGVFIKDKDEKIILKTSDLNYYFMAEAFIIRNYISIKHKISLPLSILGLELTSGLQLRIENIEEFYQVKINYENLKLKSKELLSIQIDESKLLKLSYEEIICSLEYSIDAIYNMYVLNFNNLKENQTFLNYFDYLNKVISKNYFSDFKDCW